MCMIEKVAYMQKHTSATSPYSDLGPWGGGWGEEGVAFYAHHAIFKVCNGRSIHDHCWTSSTSRKINVMVKFCVWGIVTTFRTPFFSKIGLLLYLNLPFYLVLKLEMRESKYFKNRLDVCMVKVYSDLLRCFMTSHTCNSTIVLQQKIKDDLVMLPWRCDH